MAAEQRPSYWGLIKVSYQAAAICFIDLRVATAVAILVQFGTEFFICSSHDPHSDYDTITGLICGAIRAIALSPYAVLIHRWIILQDDTAAYFGTAASPRALRFIGVSLLFVLVEVVVDGLGALDRFSGWVLLPSLVGAVVFLVVGIRLCLVFPMVAVDGSAAPFADSFDITRGSAWWLAWLFVLCVAPLGVVGVGLVELQPQVSGVLSAGTMAATAVLSVFFYAVAVALASYLYMTRADWARPREAGASSS